MASCPGEIIAPRLMQAVAAGILHRIMGYTITEIERTPNPNAVKIWLDRPISSGPRSFLNAEMAADDPIARALFEDAGVVTALFNGQWLSVNKPADADWRTVQKKVEAVLAEAS